MCFVWTDWFSPWKSQIQVTSEKKGLEPHLDPEIQPKRPCVTIFTLTTISHCHTFFPKLILTIFLFPIFFFAWLPLIALFRPPQPKISTTTGPGGFTGVSSNPIQRHNRDSYSKITGVDFHWSRLSLKSNREAAKMAAESATKPTPSRNSLLCGLASTPGGF